MKKVLWIMGITCVEYMIWVGILSACFWAFDNTDSNAWKIAIIFQVISMIVNKLLNIKKSRDRFIRGY